MSEMKSLTLNGKKYTSFVDSVARANTGGPATSLSKEQINALDALFKAASYIKDVSAEYAAFCVAFGLTNPDEPSDNIVQGIKKGSVSFENGAMTVNTGMGIRATIVPIGQYLEKGKPYRFSIGSLAGSYYYGVQILTAESAGLTFPYADDSGIITFNGVTNRIVDTGWMVDDYVYTPDTENCILAVNFKNFSNGSMDSNDYATLLENFTIKENTEEVAEFGYLIHRGVSTLDDGSLAVSGENPVRLAVYSKTVHERKYAEHNGEYWDVSPYSVIRIPRGSAFINIDIPSGMKYGVFIAKPHDNNAVSVQSVVDSGWITDGSPVSVSDYNDGSYYLGMNIAYVTNADIPEDFDTSTIDIYFVDGNGNRM